MNSVLTIILTHQPAASVARMLDYWSDFTARENILLAYGGTTDQFNSIGHVSKVFIDDPGLRTSDHPRELQSYTAIFHGAAGFLRTQPQFDYVHFMEFDHLPLARDLNQRQIEMLNAEHADVLGFHLYRIDDTSNPHFLHHSQREGFASYWQKISRRDDPHVVLSMFGSGSFWRREAFLAVAEEPEPLRMYLELYLPTLAHHFGFRLRDFGDQNRFVQVLNDETSNIDSARERGAWTLHPVKHLWTN